MAELIRVKATGLFGEANRLTAENAESTALWCGGVVVTEHHAIHHEQTYAAINVPSPSAPEHVERAQEDDWIVRHPEGHFTVMKDALFHAIFDVIK